MITRYTSLISAALLFFIGLSGCHNQPRNDAADTQKTKPLKVGAMSGPEAALVEAAANVAKKQFGLSVEVITFSDYVSPNEALHDGSIDLNAYQTIPYMEAAAKARGYKFVSVGHTFLYPIGMYAKKYARLEDLPNGAKVAIPNDPSNEARALLLLKSAGLIALIEGAGVTANRNDIATNHKKELKLISLEAAQIPRALDDVDAAIINTNFAAPAGLRHDKDTLFIETTDSPYMNIIATRQDRAQDAQVIQFVNAYQSAEVKARAQELFGDNAIAGF